MSTPSNSQKKQKQKQQQKEEATGTGTAMDGPKRAKPGFLDTAFKVITRRNSVYVSFILVGALVGERVSVEIFRVLDFIFLKFFYVADLLSGLSLFFFNTRIRKVYDFLVF